MSRVAWVCMCGLLLAAPAKADLLVDPLMNSIGPNGQIGETPDAPWVVTASRGGGAYNDGAVSMAFADHDGGGYGLYFKAWTGNPPWDPTAGAVDVTIHQDVPGTAGVTYTLTGWWGAEANFSGFHTPGANAIFGLDFFGANGLLGAAELDLEAAGLGGGPGLSYEQFSISATAPVGTVTVRARGTLNDGVFHLDPGQALVTDEWSLTSNAVPEPSSVALWSVGLGLLALRRRRRA